MIPVHYFCQAGLVGHDLGQILIRLRRFVPDALICVADDALHRLGKLRLQTHGSMKSALDIFFRRCRDQMPRLLSVSFSWTSL